MYRNEKKKKMSLDAYHQSLLSSSVNFKTFVRESDDNELSQRDDKLQKSELNFHGNEARVAYEEIVERRNETTIEKTKNAQSSTSSSSSERNKKSSDRQQKSSESRARERERTRESRKHASSKITANCVLKAVERGDVEFLERNVTSLNVNISDDYGWTPLMSAAFCGNYKIVDFLLKLGANTRCRDKSGFTAGGLASKKNYSGIVALLKEKQSLCGSEASSSGTSSPRKESDQNYERREFYCSICRETFRDTNIKRHETSTLHIFNTKPKLPGSVYSIPKANKGYQMLLNKGWKEDGLGPDGQGSKYPVKTILKRDRRGIDETRKDEARVTHFRSGDTRAVETLRRQPREKTLRKRDKERLFGKEARRERAFRRALS